MTQGIYGIYSTVSDKWYVGQSTNVSKRLSAHRTCLRGHSPSSHTNTHLLSAWRKYGEETFEFLLLEKVSAKTALTKREDFWIALKRNTSSGVYNQRIAADSNCGVIPSPEVRTKISKALKGRKKTPEHISNVVQARVCNNTWGHSLESCAKMAASHKGKALSSEHAANSAAARRGLKRSPAQCATISASLTGKKASSEARANMSAAHKGIGIPSRRALSEESVEYVRTLHENGYSCRAIAGIMQCSMSTIKRVVGKAEAYSHGGLNND